VGKKKRVKTGNEFRLTIEITAYEVRDVMLEFGSTVNILPKKYFEIIGSP
jgi:hypothetical protein